MPPRTAICARKAQTVRKIDLGCNVHVAITTNSRASGLEGNFQGNQPEHHDCNIEIGFASTSELHVSTDSILSLLRDHPDFLREPPDVLDAIIAAIISGLAILLSVVVTSVAGGAAAPVVVILKELVGLGLSAAGVAGANYAIRGIINKNFNWGEWGIACAKGAALTIVAFGAGFAMGNIVGVACRFALIQNVTKEIIASVCGALIGAGAQTGTHFAIHQLSDENYEVVEIVLDGIFGAVAGVRGALIGVRKFCLRPAMHGDKVADVFQGKLDWDEGYRHMGPDPVMIDADKLIPCRDAMNLDQAKITDYFRASRSPYPAIDVEPQPNGFFKILNGNHRFQALLRAGVNKVGCRIKITA